MRSFCLASLVTCSVWTILFLRCVGGHKQAVRISSIAAWSCISIDSAWILCPRPDRVYATEAARPYMHNTFFTFWRDRSWSGCRKLICNSCTCSFAALIGLSVPREITLLWQMLMIFLFFFLICSTGEMLMVECGRMDRSRCLAAWTESQGLKLKSPRLYLHLYFFNQTNSNQNQSWAMWHAGVDCDISWTVILTWSVRRSLTVLCITLNSCSLQILHCIELSGSNSRRRVQRTRLAVVAPANHPEEL